MIDFDQFWEPSWSQVGSENRSLEALGETLTRSSANDDEHDGEDETSSTKKTLKSHGIRMLAPQIHGAPQGADRVQVGLKLGFKRVLSPKSSQEAPGPSKRPSRPPSWLDFGSNLGLCSTSQTPKTINLGPMFGRSALKTRPTFEINPSQVYLTRCAATVPRLRVQ